tara:strand:- start:221 stop:811 length:591 start_codon:yes stop_codon:yes gene_type:complete
MDLVEDEFFLDENDDIKTDTGEDWLLKYIKNEKVFDKFYKENVKNIKLYFFYIDKHKDIIKVLKNNLDINNNIVKKDELLEIIKDKRELLNKKFLLIQILKYNFSIGNNNINKFLNNSDNFNFLKKMDIIEDIYWEDTIPLFKSLNSLYFILFEKQKRKHNTKKIRLRRKQGKTKKKYSKELKIKDTDIIKIDKKK